MKPDLSKIKELIAQKGITQGELSQKLGKHPMYITQRLSGAHNLPMNVLEDIARVLEVDAYDLCISSVPSDLTAIEGETFIQCPCCKSMIGISLKCAKIKDPEDPFADKKSCDI